jgi:hypothetical protein
LLPARAGYYKPIGAQDMSHYSWSRNISPGVAEKLVAYHGRFHNIEAELHFD